MTDPNGNGGENIAEDAKLATSALVGNSTEMDIVRNMVAQVGASDASVLICGPSGSGKELVARALHDSSARSKAPFVALNCGALPAELIESELFGHEKGSFTGALAQRVGRFEQADKGTLFLDEIGDMRYDMQVKLLRIVEDQRVTRLGSNKERAVDVRIISATHQDINIAIEDNRFRADLFFRLGVVILRIPSLAERPGDIPILMRHFQRDLPPERRVEFEDQAITCLQGHNWPGNVRELRNFVERSTILFGGQIITSQHISMLLGHLPVMTPVSVVAANNPRNQTVPAFTQLHPKSLDARENCQPVNLKNMVEQFERQKIGDALTMADGVITEAARLLGLKRTTLTEKMRKYGLEAVQSQ